MWIKYLRIQSFFLFINFVFFRKIRTQVNNLLNKATEISGNKGRKCLLSWDWCFFNICWILIFFLFYFFFFYLFFICWKLHDLLKILIKFYFYDKIITIKFCREIIADIIHARPLIMVSLLCHVHKMKMQMQIKMKMQRKITSVIQRANRMRANKLMLQLNTSIILNHRLLPWLWNQFGISPMLQFYLRRQ